MKITGRAGYTLLPLLFILVLLGACSSMNQSTALNSRDGHQVSTSEREYGVEVQSVRLSAADTIIDLRYKIIDPDKAMRLTARNQMHSAHGKHAMTNTEAYLVDQKTGYALTVPKAAKIGPLRQVTDNAPPKEGSVFFMLFGNGGRMLKSGDLVDLVVGEFKVAGLMIE